MNLFDETFIKDYCEDCFNEFVSDISVTLEKENMDYKKTLEEMEKILCDFPNLRRTLEDCEYLSLNEKEVKALVNYLQLLDRIRHIEEREIFLVGMKEAYYLFKRLKIIQD